MLNDHCHRVSTHLQSINIILYIILYYYDYGDQLKGLSWVGLVAEGDAGLMAGFLKAGSVGTR